MMMVQLDAEVGSEGAELVVGEVGPGLAGEVQGALMLEGGRGDFKMLQQGVQHAQVEGCVVGDDEVGAGEVGDDFGGDAAEFGLVAHVEPADAVDVLGPFFFEPAVTFGRLDEPVRGLDELEGKWLRLQPNVWVCIAAEAATTFKGGKPERTGAQGAVIGGFKIKGDDFHEGRVWLRGVSHSGECAYWVKPMTRAGGGAGVSSA